jgi:hypothetical protein
MAIAHLREQGAGVEWRGFMRSLGFGFSWGFQGSLRGFYGGVSLDSVKPGK